MVGEKLNQNSETTPNQNDSFEYPPFDLEKAKERVAKARMLSSVEEISNDELRQRVLDHEEEIEPSPRKNGTRRKDCEPCG